MARKTSARDRVPIALGSARVEAAVREQQELLAAAIGTLAAAGVEEVHRARVAARRLRSMLKTFRPLLEPRRARLYRADLRSFARTLGAAREADVRRDLLLGLARADARIPATDRRGLALLLDDACIEARGTLRRHLAEPGWAALVAALERHRVGQALYVTRDASLADVVALVERTWRRPVRLLREEPRESAELHELRLAFKHCRYALEVVADEAPRDTARLLRRLRAAQDRIGDHRDTLLAEHWLQLNERRLGGGLVERLRKDLSKRERQLRRQAAVRAAKVLEAWRSWRDATRNLRKAATRARR